MKRPYLYLRFFFTFLALSAVTVAYMGTRLATGPGQWALLGLIVALVMLFPIAHWRGKRVGPTALQDRLQQLGYLAMGYVSFVLVLTVARDVYLLGARVFGGAEYYARTAEATAGWPPFVFALLFSGLGILWALFAVRVREVVVPVENLPAGLENLRIAQISDLHIGPMIGGAYVRRVLARVKAAQPDLTVLTGDIVDGVPAKFAEEAALLAELGPKGRVFFAPGNHEYYHDLPGWLPVLRGLGIEPLLNAGRKVEAVGGEIWVGGVTDPAAPAFGGEEPSPAKAAQGGEGSDFRLLLSHRPELIRAAGKAGFHLQLSGHTHGGQFFPWTIVAARVHEHVLGLHRESGAWLYVSPGTGSWGPPLRLGTTPEVTLLKIVKEKRVARDS